MSDRIDNTIDDNIQPDAISRFMRFQLTKVSKECELNTSSK